MKDDHLKAYMSAPTFAAAVTKMLETALGMSLPNASEIAARLTNEFVKCYDEGHSAGLAAGRAEVQADLTAALAMDKRLTLPPNSEGHEHVWDYEPHCVLCCNALKDGAAALQKRIDEAPRAWAVEIWGDPKIISDKEYNATSFGQPVGHSPLLDYKPVALVPLEPSATVSTEDLP